MDGRPGGSIQPARESRQAAKTPRVWSRQTMPAENSAPRSPAANPRLLGVFAAWRLSPRKWVRGRSPRCPKPRPSGPVPGAIVLGVTEGAGKEDGAAIVV